MMKMLSSFDLNPTLRVVNDVLWYRWILCYGTRVGKLCLLGHLHSLDCLLKLLEPLLGYLLFQTYWLKGQFNC